MDTRDAPLSEGLPYDGDYGFPSDEELTACADKLFLMYDEEERSANGVEKP
jgi:hypothetical protein